MKALVHTTEDKGKRKVELEDVQNMAIEQSRRLRTRYVVRKTKMQVKEISQP